MNVSSFFTGLFYCCYSRNCFTYTTLNQIVELLQKPIGQAVLMVLKISRFYSQLEKLNVNMDDIKAANLT
jgi:hypothetical protein